MWIEAFVTLDHGLTFVRLVLLSQISHQGTQDWRVFCGIGILYSVLQCLDHSCIGLVMLSCCNRGLAVVGFGQREIYIDGIVAL
jgi:hypothetical protein